MIRIVLAQTACLNPARRVHPWLIFVGVVFGVGVVVFFGIFLVLVLVLVLVLFLVEIEVLVVTVVLVLVFVLMWLPLCFGSEQEKTTCLRQQDTHPPWYRFLCRILHKSRETFVSETFKLSTSQENRV